jgi:hypothetical protein
MRKLVPVIAVSLVAMFGAALVPVSTASATTTYTFPRYFHGSFSGCETTFTAEPEQCAFVTFHGTLHGLTKQIGCIGPSAGYPYAQCDYEFTGLSGHVTGWEAQGNPRCSRKADFASSDVFFTLRSDGNAEYSFGFAPAAVFPICNAFVDIQGVTGPANTDWFLLAWDYPTATSSTWQAFCPDGPGPPPDACNSSQDPTVTGSVIMNWTGTVTVKGP